MFVLDTHCDTPTLLIKGMDLGKGAPDGQVDLAKLKAGGVDASFFALYTSAELSPEASPTRALEMLASIYDAVGQYPDQVAIAIFIVSGSG